MKNSPVQTIVLPAFGAKASAALKEAPLQYSITQKRINVSKTTLETVLANRGSRLTG